MPPWRRFAKCRVAHANRSFHKFGVLYLGVLKKGSYYLGYYTRVPYFRKLPIHRSTILLAPRGRLIGAWGYARPGPWTTYLFRVHYYGSLTQVLKMVGYLGSRKKYTRRFVGTLWRFDRFRGSFDYGAWT